MITFSGLTNEFSSIDQLINLDLLQKWLAFPCLFVAYLGLKANPDSPTVPKYTKWLMHVISIVKIKYAHNVCFLLLIFWQPGSSSKS